MQLRFAGDPVLVLVLLISVRVGPGTTTSIFQSTFAGLFEAVNSLSDDTAFITAFVVYLFFSFLELLAFFGTAQLFAHSSPVITYLYYWQLLQDLMATIMVSRRIAGGVTPRGDPSGSVYPSHPTTSTFCWALVNRR